MNNITFPDGIQWQQGYITGGDLFEGDMVFSVGNFYRDASNVTIYINYDIDLVTDMSYMFSGCRNVTYIYAPQLDTSSVTNMSYMFGSCLKLTSIPQLDTSSVTNMSNMFSNCMKLTSIPQLDTSSVTNMSSMFSGCNTLTSIPLLDTGKVTSMSALFGYGQNTSLKNLGGFKDLKISITSYFLDYAPNLTVESLMNVINNLYDLTANGVSGKTLKFGTTNLNKLTAEQIAVATNKGWTLT